MVCFGWHFLARPDIPFEQSARIADVYRIWVVLENDRSVQQGTNAADGKPPAKFRGLFRERHVKFGADFREVSAKMAKRKKARQKRKTALDTSFERRGRGRPPRMKASEVCGRAYNYRIIFGQLWDKIGNRLLGAETTDGIVQTLAETSYDREFESLAPLILNVVHEPDFPRRDNNAQVNFLADSLAARGELTARTSRDICARERAKEAAQSSYEIIRYEYYIECSCGYKGPARDNACRKCGAEIRFPLRLGSTLGLT